MIPVFYGSFVAALDSRARKYARFLSRFLDRRIAFGLVAGAVIDRVGAKWVILAAPRWSDLPCY